jgi:hypothetical protein
MLFLFSGWEFEFRSEKEEMFSTLSSYIWSSGSEDQTVPDLEDNSLEQRSEDEWILVDLVNEKTKPHSGMTLKTRHKILCMQ